MTTISNTFGYSSHYLLPLLPCSAQEEELFRADFSVEKSWTPSVVPKSDIFMTDFEQDVVFSDLRDKVLQNTIDSLEKSDTDVVKKVIQLVDKLMENPNRKYIGWMKIARAINELYSLKVTPTDVRDLYKENTASSAMKNQRQRAKSKVPYLMEKHLLTFPTSEDVEAFFEQELEGSVENTMTDKDRTVSNDGPVIEGVKRVSKEIGSSQHSKSSIKPLTQVRARKSLWTKDQDDFLISLFKKRVESGLSWKDITKKMNEKFFKQLSNKACRDRFTRQLDPELIRSPFTLEDMETIKKLLETGIYYNKGDIKSPTYSGIHYMALAKKIKRADTSIRWAVLSDQICASDPFFIEIREIENKRIKNGRKEVRI